MSIKHDICFYNIISVEFNYNHLVFSRCEKIAVLLLKDFSHLISSKYGRHNTRFSGFDLNVGVIAI